MLDADVIVIGSGGGGAVAAKELGELGLKVLVLEAGPWYGNSKWPDPNRARGAEWSSSHADLDVGLYKKIYNAYENNMNDGISGAFRFGPADRRRTPWHRVMRQRGDIWQLSGVGGTTQHYWAQSPRAFPSAVDNIWPISYRELVPYYEKAEATLPVQFAPMAPKEELFFYGAKKAGWSLIPTLDVVTPGYRPHPNAILPPNEHLMDPKYSMDQLHEMEGCTMKGNCVNGCTAGPTVDKIAKRGTLVSYIPLALKTGNVSIRPNTFVIKVLTGHDPKEGLRATGVQFRDTWTGEIGELKAKAVVMAAGCIESPRLWMNSGLPYNEWVGRGLTIHYFDWVSGVFDEKDLIDIMGIPTVDPFVGHTSGGRVDIPGLGSTQVSGLSPGLHAFVTYGFSDAGYNALNPPEPGAPWNIRGRVVGPELKELMMNYRRTMSMLILADDETLYHNRVTVDPLLKDEHGPLPVVHYAPSKKTLQRRDQLAKHSAEILKGAGAKTIIRSDTPAGWLLHIESTMRMGYVVDTNCEAFQVKRLYIADNSVHYNGIGGPNPTLTTQALATRMAEKLAKTYFS
ncbi:GMC family oxidoreductase N-terminal domain-containing protein [Paenibacillus oryzisoli]|uniref:Glucose-methanol-choline oxidoreductase n=1 Tax=Paenibacillus oryzisoli TaxID=1850517 RepID=A0A197ZXA5_9BACL|nr:GMC family oxidoreductase N-terminal domain-containing protein [Paenibacillus oryzisoli]OAS13462.1 glucose-methanol-choline oxidoreductase [Paenibacillus oryzisoli]